MYLRRLRLEGVCADLVRFLRSRGDAARCGAVPIDREYPLGPAAPLGERGRGEQQLEEPEQLALVRLRQGGEQRGGGGQALAPERGAAGCRLGCQRDERRAAIGGVRPPRDQALLLQ